MNNKFVEQNAKSCQPEIGAGLVSWINEFLKDTGRPVLPGREGETKLETPKALARGQAVFYMDVCIDESKNQGVNI